MDIISASQSWAGKINVKQYNVTCVMLWVKQGAVGGNCTVEEGLGDPVTFTCHLSKEHSSADKSFEGRRKCEKMKEDISRKDVVSAKPLR